MCSATSATSATASCAESRQRHPSGRGRDKSSVSSKCGCILGAPGNPVSVEPSWATRSCRASRPLGARHRRRLFGARDVVPSIAAGPAAPPWVLSSPGVQPVSFAVRCRPPRALAGACAAVAEASLLLTGRDGVSSIAAGPAASLDDTPSLPRSRGCCPPQVLGPCPLQFDVARRAPWRGAARQLPRPPCCSPALFSLCTFTEQGWIGESPRGCCFSGRSSLLFLPPGISREKDTWCASMGGGPVRVAAWRFQLRGAAPARGFIPHGP